MKNILQINSSLFSTGGQSSQLADQFVATAQHLHPGASLIRRDLARDPIPHLEAATFVAFTTKPADRTAEQLAAIALSDALIAELNAADTIVFGLPMYNFGVPSTLKAYFDHIARAGVTFNYTANGPVGLLTGKKVYLFATRGGKYQGTARDTQTTYLRDFLAFLGMTDVEIIYAEGLAMGDDAKLLSLAQARDEIAKYSATSAYAAPLPIAA